MGYVENGPDFGLNSLGFSMEGPGPYMVIPEWKSDGTPVEIVEEVRGGGLASPDHLSRIHLPSGGYSVKRNVGEMRGSVIDLFADVDPFLEHEYRVMLEANQIDGEEIQALRDVILENMPIARIINGTTVALMRGDKAAFRFEACDMAPMPFAFLTSLAHQIPIDYEPGMRMSKGASRVEFSPTSIEFTSPNKTSVMWDLVAGLEMRNVRAEALTSQFTRITRGGRISERGFRNIVRPFISFNPKGRINT